MLFTRRLLTKQLLSTINYKLDDYYARHTDDEAVPGHQSAVP